jgi:ribosome biogenesis GTPase A
MAQALRQLERDLPAIDVVVEVVDARVPISGRNLALAAIAARKRHVVALAREDLADPHATFRWLEHLRAHDETAIALDAKSPGSLSHLRALLADRVDERKTSRVVVLGVPNAGKSTVINGLIRKRVARIEDRAGVTRAAQWFRIGPALEVMDTAGILMPKIETAQAQWMLALTGALPRARYDPEDVVAQFSAWLPGSASRRMPIPDLAGFAEARGFVRRGNVADTHNAAWAYIKAFNDGGFGRLTLEWPKE